MVQPIHIRRAAPADARALAELLQEIVDAGGTTALTGQITRKDIVEWMRTSARAAWHVAEDNSGEILGFQWIEPMVEDPEHAAEIATFARKGKTGMGIGSRLFEATETAARQLGYRWIRANIRADNEGGLIYYQSRGFEDYGRIENYRMADGTVVDKRLKRFDL
ncbi:GNAT family N-acetyltransferase [Sulfitobacter alexandrii]|uniref:GNAT family N-acetyltransferase n=1 Tax=Sulfitobacter alexandrii TaxID=1917485 RepID=A0A1J0WLM5_9RHOB|nr:GNAT family N-acetyltransferase [Sulfitobacter alexandrii]APE45070.1 GNAT family N-acetyltransferase [Sulfitobacter alexandrii]